MGDGRAKEVNDEEREKKGLLAEIRDAKALRNEAKRRCEWSEYDRWTERIGWLSERVRRSAKEKAA